MLVTRGAGFIGSYLVDRLEEGFEVTVFGNLSSGSLEHKLGNYPDAHFRLVRKDTRI